MDGFHVKGVSEDNRDTCIGTEVGQPVPGEHTCDGDDETLAIRGNGFQEGIRVGLHMTVQQELPSVCTGRTYVEAGCLMGYNASTEGGGRQSAAYVDKILRGAKPADLPVEQPTRFEFVINLKTAQALGLTLPPMVLFQADKVIR